jgi:hypothetical protein
VELFEQIRREYEFGVGTVTAQAVRLPARAIETRVLAALGGAGAYPTRDRSGELWAQPYPTSCGLRLTLHPDI